MHPGQYSKLPRSTLVASPTPWVLVLQASERGVQPARQTRPLFFELSPDLHISCCCPTPGKAIDAEGEASADTLPPTPHHHTTTEVADVAPALTTAPHQHFDAVGDTRKLRNHAEQLGFARSKPSGAGENDCLHDAPYTARPPAKPRPVPTPLYARGTSAGGGGVCRR